MKRPWIFNRPALLEGGLAGRWTPATKKNMRTIKKHLEALPHAAQLDAFNKMVMLMLQHDKEFHQDGVEQGFVVPIRGGDGAYSCCHWQGDRDWI